MQVLQRRRQLHSQLEAFAKRKSSAQVQFALEGLGRVIASMNLLAGLLIIGQLHYIIKVALGIVPPDMEHVHLAFVRARNRFKLLNTAKLAFVGTLLLERAAIYNFYRAICAGDAPRQPHLAVASATNRPQEFIFWYLWWGGSDVQDGGLGRVAPF